MKKVPPASHPRAFVAALDGWRRRTVEALCAAVRGAAAFEEGIKWGNLVFFANGPAVVIHVDETRVLYVFLRGQRLLHLEPRLKVSGKYELASLELREGTSLPPARARRLAREAAALNQALGDPTKAAKGPKAAARKTKTTTGRQANAQRNRN
jgi:hypothetical protein